MGLTAGKEEQEPTAILPALTWTRSVNRPAFTLLELLVVVAILALVSGAAALRLAPVYERARAEAFTRALLDWEQGARMQAWRTGEPSALEFDLERQRVKVLAKDRDGQHARQHENVTRELRFPRCVELVDVRRVDQIDAGGKRRSQIPVTRLGESPSYFLELKRAGDKSEWIVLVGTSGQPERRSDEKNAIRLLRQLQDSRQTPALRSDSR
jgi:prepilin-type N-terminal cleavage/methylation domain-containing protein